MFEPIPRMPSDLPDQVEKAVEALIAVDQGAKESTMLLASQTNSFFVLHSFFEAFSILLNHICGRNKLLHMLIC